MSNTPRLPMNDEQKGLALGAAFRRIQRANGPAEYTAAVKDAMKVARNVGLTEAQADALGKLVEQPGEVAALAIKTMISLAEKNASQLIELKRQWADAYMKQGNSIAGVASAARAIGSICAMFGADDFAKYLNEKADAEMAKADVHFAKARTKMEEDTGATESMRKSVVDALAILNDKTPGHDIAAATTAAVLNAAKSQTADIYELGADGVPAKAVPAAKAEAAGQRITWKQFHENMASAGIDAATQAQMQKLFDKNASFDAASKPGVVDSAVEGDKLVRGINKSEALTAKQKQELVEKLHLAAPQFVPSWAG